MTCKEMLRIDHPEVDYDGLQVMIDDTCPSDYGYTHGVTYKNCNNDCDRCWMQEVQGHNKLIYEHIPGNEIGNVMDIKEENGGITATIKPIIKDSGDRTEFATGAVRDMHEGKGDMISLPSAAILRLSKHYENGALKYGRWNYTKGIPVSSFLDSALRHLFKYLDGWDDEDHLSAAAFNVLGAMEMEAHHKELNDLPTRKGKNNFDYTGR